MKLTKDLSEDYKHLYKTSEIRETKRPYVNKIINKILKHKEDYKSVSRKTNVPWFIIGIIHSLESNNNFGTHLHNGDPLSAKTVQVPRGRPTRGQPPFTWTESAIDALLYDRLNAVSNWEIDGCLFVLEGYNGWGYRKYHPTFRSPYLWSFTTKYTAGKYVADGKWSSIAVSKQCGAATLLKALEEANEISFEAEETKETNEIIFSDHKIKGADKLQAFLNTFPGISLSIDSWPGKKTSEAFKLIFGMYLKKDPR